MYSTKPFINRARPTSTAKSKQIQCLCQVLANFGLWPFAIPGSVSHGIFCFAGSALVAIGAEPKPNQNEMYSTKPFINRARPTSTAKSKQIQCLCQVLANFGLWPFAIPGSVSHGIFCFAGSALVAIGAEPKPNQNEMYSTKPFINRARPTSTAKSKQIQCLCQVLANFGLWPFAIPGSVSHGIFCFAGSALVAIGAEPKPNQNEMYSTKPFINRARPTSTAKSKQIQCLCQVLANFGLWPFAIPGSVSHGIFCFAGSALVAIGAEPKPNQNEMYSTKPFINRARPTSTAKSKQIQCLCQVLANFGLWPFAIPGSVSHGIFCFAGSALVAIGRVAGEPLSNGRTD